MGVSKDITCLKMRNLGINGFGSSSSSNCETGIPVPIGSMGLVYLPTFWLIFMVNVGKYTSPMDPKGYINILRTGRGNMPRNAITSWNAFVQLLEVNPLQLLKSYLGHGSKFFVYNQRRG